MGRWTLGLPYVLMHNRVGLGSSHGHKRSPQVDFLNNPSRLDPNVSGGQFTTS